MDHKIQNYIAQNETIIVGKEGAFLSGFGKFGDRIGFRAKFPDIISIIISILAVIAGLWFVFQVISGGISILGAGSDKAKLAQGQSQIINGIIGFIIVISSMFIIGFITEILGIPNFLDISQLILDIGA